ncbi:MAG: hypothetical protein QOK47_858 [Actinomycetota bacterium]|nr:hypothetical protein [Actinomycetota bacterium]
MILAHGVGQVYKLPIPLPLYLGAAAATVLVSFVLRMVVPQGARRTEERTVVGARPARILIVVLQVLAVVLLVLAILSGAIVRERGLTLGPLGFWVGLIVGVTALSSLLGDVWEHIDPWRTIEDTYRIKDVEVAERSFPWWVGPFLVYMLFWFELVSNVGFESFWIVVVLALYSLYVFTFRAGLGEGWRQADPLSILFGFAARCAPLRIDRDGIHFRGLLRGLDERTPMPLALYSSVFILLASTTLDNVKETTGWTSFLTSTGLESVSDTIVNSLALLLFALPFFAAFMLATWVAHRWIGRRLSVSELGRHLGWSLIPIGVAYVLAHNASLLIADTPQLLRALSDPFLKGWNLFGTADWFATYQPSPKLVWFLEIALIVGGHILGVLAAHRTAVRFSDDHRAAVRSELPLTLMMAAFTISTLWLLAQPLVVSG